MAAATSFPLLGWGHHPQFLALSLTAGSVRWDGGRGEFPGTQGRGGAFSGGFRGNPCLRGLRRQKAFYGLVREIFAEQFPGKPIRWRRDALELLREAGDGKLVFLFEDVSRAARHGRRVTAMQKDLHLVLDMRGESHACTCRRNKRDK